MKLKILQNNLLKENYYLLVLEANKSLAQSRPGQFVHVRVDHSLDPLLRRPFSIYDVLAKSKKQNKVTVKILYEVVGRGTQILSQKRPGVSLDVLGPLGHGFDLGYLTRCKNICLVAGGMGVAPLFYLARRLRHLKPKNKITCLIGARSKPSILMEDAFRKLGCRVSVVTEDGSRGTKGRVTDLMHSWLAEEKESVVCSCGPKAMLAAVSQLSRQFSVECFVSMEEFMGCGVGACLGCVIKTKRGFERICHEGPVFTGEDILWEEKG